MDERQFNVPDCLYCLFLGLRRRPERRGKGQYERVQVALSLAGLAGEGVEGTGLLEWRL
jgi:hypothetical protein